MKSLPIFISEKLKITSDNISVKKNVIVNTKEELKQKIVSALSEDKFDLDLSHIQLGPDIDKLDGLFNGKQNIKSIDLSGWNVSNVKKFDGMFAHCYNLEEIYGLNDWNFGENVSFYKMFYECRSLKRVNIDNWDVSNAKNFSYMFYNCKQLNKYLNNWRISYDKASIFNMCKNSNITVLK